MMDMNMGSDIPRRHKGASFSRPTSAAQVLGCRQRPIQGPSDNSKVPNMTFTVMAHCPETGRIGVGIATYSLAVGGYCPWVDGGVGAISTQANVNLKLGPLGMRLLAMGFAPRKVLSELASDDQSFSYRQIGIIDRVGRALAHTGPDARDWKGHHCGDGYLTMGNGLVGEHVIDAMASAFESTTDQSLDERLLASLEAGRDAGGQGDAVDGHRPERSAGLHIYNGEPYPEMDLRVDVHDTAVEELRRIHTAYKPYIPYYELRHRDPEHTPAQHHWAKDLERRMARGK
jgi:uncharacterized Ntn-hydrolase superfamily protein